MVLDYARRQPVGDPLALHLIAVERPDRFAVLAGRPGRAGRRGVDRVLGREHQPPAGRQAACDGLIEARAVRDIVEGERAVRQVERSGRQLEAREVGRCVDDGRIAGRRARPLQHPGRQIEAEHCGRTRFAGPAAEPAHAAAEVDHLQSGHVGQHRPQRRPLRRAVEPLDRAAEPAVAREEGRVVVDVLAHEPTPIWSRTARICSATIAGRQRARASPGSSQTKRSCSASSTTASPGGTSAANAGQAPANAVGRIGTSSPVSSFSSRRAQACRSPGLQAPSRRRPRPVPLVIGTVVGAVQNQQFESIPNAPIDDHGRPERRVLGYRLAVVGGRGSAHGTSTFFAPWPARMAAKASARPAAVSGKVAVTISSSFSDPSA